MFDTPFKLTGPEHLCSAAASLCLEHLERSGTPISTVGSLTESIQYGYTASASTIPSDVRFLRITDIKGGHVDWASVPYCECPVPGSYLLKEGDLLVARSGSVGKSFLVEEVPEPAVFASYLIRLRTKPAFTPGFAYWCLQSRQFWSQLLEMDRGSAMSNVNGRMLAQLQFPVPHTSIQSAVVAFLSTFRARLRGDAVAHKSLPAPLGGVPRIVARIEELAKQVEEANALRQYSTNHTEALTASVLRGVFQRPDARRVILDDVCSNIIDNLHRNPVYAESGVPCVRSADVGYGSLNLESALRTDEDEYVRRTVRGEPEPDDIVFVREGGGTGKCACVLPGQRFSLGQRVMMLRPNRVAVHPRFLLYQLLSPLVQDDQIAPLCKGSASPHLNIGALRKFSILVPPVEVQSALVAELDALQTEVDRLRRLQADSSAELDALMPAILDRAFKGEL